MFNDISLIEHFRIKHFFHLALNIITEILFINNIKTLIQKE